MELSANRLGRQNTSVKSLAVPTHLPKGEGNFVRRFATFTLSRASGNGLPKRSRLVRVEKTVKQGARVMYRPYRRLSSVR